jgi:hypothetical protein
MFEASSGFLYLSRQIGKSTAIPIENYPTIEKAPILSILALN